MIPIVDQIKNATQLRWNRIHQFQPKLRLEIALGPYLIKTAETPDELIASFKLRHEVFNNEFRGIYGAGLDFDKFDSHFDHLLIIHQDTKRVIGTYRLSCSLFSTRSYVAEEFEISHLQRVPEVRLELGRACIRQEFRKGSVISLLWRGIAEYMNLSKAEILFGCSSLKLNHGRDAALVYRYLIEKEICYPQEDFRMAAFDSWYSIFRAGLNPEQQTEAEAMIPALLKSYLKMGALVVCEPAFDADFDCIDLLTVLKRQDLSNSLAQRFQVNR